MRDRAGRRRVIVAGGGTAGISLSFLLAEAGLEVVLLEASSRLGGRVFSFASSLLGGGELDNGPHVLAGAYKEFPALLGKLGTEGMFSHAPSLDLSFLARGGRIHRLRAPAFLPAPLHLLAGLLRFTALSPKERLRAAWAVGRLVGGKEIPGRTVAEWCRERGLLGRPVDFFLGPLCRAILNTREEEASLELFAAALGESFRGPPSRAALWVPSRPWSEILGRPARKSLESKGVEVRLGTRLEGVEVERGRFRAACLREEKLAGDALFLCLPPWRLAGLLPAGAVRGDWASLRPAPMEILYVKVKKQPGRQGPVPQVLGLPPGEGFDFLVPGRGRAWAFLATPARPRRGEEESRASLAGRALACLGSLGAGRLEREQDVLHLVWPKALLHQPAGVERLRPGPVTEVEGLFLAGDWIDTGLPATLESAARSGRLAARAFLEKLGKGMKLKEGSGR